MSAVIALVGGLAAFLPTSASAVRPAPVTVQTTTSPASGTVDPGATVTYTLHAQSQQRLSAGTTVIDDLSGLLNNATVTTPTAKLAKRGLTLDAKAQTLTWKLLPSFGARRVQPGGQHVVPGDCGCDRAGRDEADHRRRPARQLVRRRSHMRHHSHRCRFVHVVRGAHPVAEPDDLADFARVTHCDAEPDHYADFARVTHCVTDSDHYADFARIPHCVTDADTVRVRHHDAHGYEGRAGRA